MADSTRTKIILAAMGLIGGIGGALIANWEKFSHKPDQTRPVATSPNAQGSQIIQGNNNVQISGSNNVISSGIDDESRAKLGTLDATTSAIDSKTDVLVSRSERQPQIAMTEFVSFSDRRRAWLAPNEIYPGSIVELHGFTCSLTVKTDAGFVATVPGRGWSQASEVVIIGNSGAPSKWSISAGSNCEGKVLVFSSPRIRSIQRSWSEEGDVR